MEPYSRNGSIIGQTMDFGSTDRYITGYAPSYTYPSYVGGLVYASIGTTSTVTLSLSGTLTGGIATSPASTDLVIAVWAQAWSGTVGAFKLSGFTQVLNTASDDSYDTWLSIGRRWGGTSISITGGTQNASYAGALAVHVWRDVDQTTPIGTSVFLSSGLNTALPNPPAITTTTPYSRIIVAGGSCHIRGAVSFGSDATFFRTIGSNATVDATVGIGSYSAVNPITYDPAQWSFGGVDDVAFSAPAATFAINPTITYTPVYGNYKNSGIWDLPSVYAQKTGV